MDISDVITRATRNEAPPGQEAVSFKCVVHGLAIPHERYATSSAKMTYLACNNLRQDPDDKKGKKASKYDKSSRKGSTQMRCRTALDENGNCPACHRKPDSTKELWMVSVTVVDCNNGRLHVTMFPSEAPHVIREPKLSAEQWLAMQPAEREVVWEEFIQPGRWTNFLLRVTPMYVTGTFPRYALLRRNFYDYTSHKGRGEVTDEEIAAVIEKSRDGAERRHLMGGPSMGAAAAVNATGTAPTDIQCHKTTNKK
eukprot:jgi/Mesvir1/19408/Mv10438-RA.1